MTHPPDVIPKYAPDATSAPSGEAEEMQRRTTRTRTRTRMTTRTRRRRLPEAAAGTAQWRWQSTLPRRVLGHPRRKGAERHQLLKEPPGGELAILASAGKDATAEFDMIHPPDVVGIYAPVASIGDGGTGGGGDGAKKKKEKKHKKVGKPVVVDKGDLLAIHQAWGHLDGRDNWREGEMDSNPGVFPINVRAYFYAAWYLLCAGLDDVAVTIFVNNNLKIFGDRKGLTRSAIALVCSG